MLAIDVCNAQHAVNTLENSGCGVFPWEPYMERLSVSQGDFVNEQALGFCFNVREDARMTGNVEDIRAGRLTAADKRCLAEFMVSKAAQGTSTTMPQGNNAMTLAKFMGLASSDFDEGAKRFRDYHQRCLGLIRKMLAGGGAQMLIL